MGGTPGSAALQTIFWRLTGYRRRHPVRPADRCRSDCDCGMSVLSGADAVGIRRQECGDISQTLHHDRHHRCGRVYDSGLISVMKKPWHGHQRPAVRLS